MGYGTTLTPTLLMLGYDPLQIVPAVLVSELFTGFTSAGAHHIAGNVNLDFRNDENHVKKRLGKLGYLPRSADAKVAGVLGLCSVVGTIAAVYIAINISKTLVKTYIGVLVLAMGLVILKNRGKVFTFTWGKIIGIGTLAAFNKGLSGGGYGPLVASGQVISGVKAKSAVGITSLSEALTCLVGVLAYLATGAVTDWNLAPSLVTGAMLSVPFATYTVKKLPEQRFTLLVGGATTFLGIYTLANVL